MVQSVIMKNVSVDAMTDDFEYKITKERTGNYDEELGGDEIEYTIWELEPNIGGPDESIVCTTYDGRYAEIIVTTLKKHRGISND